MRHLDKEPQADLSPEEPDKGHDATLLDPSALKTTLWGMTGTAIATSATSKQPPAQSLPVRSSLALPTPSSTADLYTCLPHLLPATAPPVATVVADPPSRQPEGPSASHTFGSLTFDRRNIESEPATDTSSSAAPLGGRAGEFIHLSNCDSLHSKRPCRFHPNKSYVAPFPLPPLIKLRVFLLLGRLIA